MRRCALLLAALLLAASLLAAGCDEGPPIPNADVLLRIAVGAETVAPGRAFPVTVVRVWEKDLVPAPFEERSLAPISLRLETTTRREDARHVEETRRYSGYAFTLSNVSIRPPVFTAAPKDGGPVRKTTGDPVRLRVEPELDPKKPGDPEGPGELLLATRSAWPRVIGIAILLAAIGGLLLRARARRVPESPIADRPARRIDPAARALERLGASGGTAVEVAAIVREYLGERFGLPALERTTEEILAEGSARGDFVPETRSSLASVLASCDLVKFAAREETAAERNDLVRGAERLVRQMAHSTLPNGIAAP